MISIEIADRLRQFDERPQARAGQPVEKLTNGGQFGRFPEQSTANEERLDGAALVEEYGGLEDAREELDAALPGRLRKSVLQMAVQGKLVSQNPADEPASALLGRIREQRAELVRQKKMKAPKGGESVIFTGSDGRRYEKRVDSKGRESEPVCIEDEIPFEIPESWEWARLGSLVCKPAMPSR